MAGPSSLKTPNSLHDSSTKPPSSSSLSSIKLKTLLHTFILSHMYRISRALTQAKSLLLQLPKDANFIHLLRFPLKKSKISKQKELFFGSFRLHYNWCSSHVMPVVMENYSSRSSNVNNYDEGDTVVFPTSCGSDEAQDSKELSGYLKWLEEKGIEEDSSNEIDKLADLFIANCHEKFRLEKQESYRKLQEMMARSL